jgi:hypothetical protein
MSNNIATGNFAGDAVTLATTETGDVHTPHHRDPEAIALLQNLLDKPDPDGGATEVTLAAVLAKLIVAPATEAGQAIIAGHIDGVEAALASILAKIIVAPSTEAKQDSEIAAVNRVGTRAYGAVQRIAAGAATTLSTAITATEVLLHASTKQYVLAVSGTGSPTVTAETAIPLEAGEKFHMRITSGQRIATIRDNTDGFLHIAPVA